MRWPQSDRVRKSDGFGNRDCVLRLKRGERKEVEEDEEEEEEEGAAVGP